MDSQAAKTTGADPVNEIRQLVEQAKLSPEGLSTARALLIDLQRSAEEASLGGLGRFIGLQAKLLDIVDCTLAAESAEEEDVDRLLEFVLNCLSAIHAALEEDESWESRIADLSREASERWGEFIRLVEEENREDFSEEPFAEWNQYEGETGQEAAEEEPDLEVPSDEDLTRLLAQLGTDASESRNEISRKETFAEINASPPPASVQGETHTNTPVSPGEAGADLPRDLIEAYLDDASRGVAMMEEAILAFEADPENREPLNQIRRELHTLKGASGSVGLSELSQYLHRVEETLRASCESNGLAPDINSLFQVVDKLRKQIASLAEGDPAAASPGVDAEVKNTANAPRAPLSLTDDGNQHEDSLRVKASQLDRLMDMLAELVMLRNRRDSCVSGLEQIHQDVILCVSRLRTICDNESLNADTATQFRYFTEVANDMMEIARRLRRFYEPITEENLTVTRFIRQFRQEVVELRQTPASGLFRRLQRTVRDAAEAEGKQVRMRVIGEDTGIERSLQERLFEPLLHIVRNAVSHGIESEAERRAAKKDAVGRITLEARSGTNLLTIEIRDDGKGLDYDALRRRGLEKGLLSADRVHNRQELAQLIFNPGFSTKETVSQISGRGVGMDVVASTLQRMRSWVEVDSTPGKGTTIRLTIPLRSVIEHTMVFRSADQLFAVPMQFVQSAGDVASDDASTAGQICFSDLFPMPGAEHASRLQKIVIRCGGLGAVDDSGFALDTNEDLTLLVDEIVGPEEVVLRPLPQLLKSYQLFSGATLSGSGDIMFVFDCRRLVELCLSRRSTSEESQPAGWLGNTVDSKRLLVVDDSMSARRVLIRYLSRYGHEIVEARDGQEALDFLRRETFAAVFTDLEMPRLGGFEVLREIRENRRDADLPVVLVTSRTEESMKKKAAALGVTAYLTKPVAEKVLADVISKIPSIRV